MESSRSVPGNLYSSVKTIHPIQNSASVQSHLSAPSSQQRIRNLTFAPFPEKEKKNASDVHDIEANYSQSSTTIWTISAVQVFRRLTSRRWLRWILGSYCLLSVFFLSFNHFSVSPVKYQFSSWKFTAQKLTQAPSASVLETLPISHMVSKASALYPAPGALLPYVLRSDNQLDTVTACVWASESELDLLPVWMSKWPGLVSLLVSSTAQPDSPEFDRLSQKLSYLRHQFPRKNWLSLHLIWLDSQAPRNPNAFLNFARLFSETPRVVLFPGNLSVVPSKALYRSYFSDPTSSAKNASHRAMVFTSRGQTSHPFSAFAPVVLNRDDPLWCTERFFPFVSRETDWAECMWQVWLEYFGDVDIKQTTDWVRGMSGAPEAASMVNKLRRRLSSKYRTETCMLATRQLAALKTPERRGADAKKSRWLKRNCREWMTLA